MDKIRYRSALNVAEKPSVAKSVTEILSRRSANRLNTDSKFNPVFEFDYMINSEVFRMIFTSVRGHIMNYEFGPDNKQWIAERIYELYDAEIFKKIVEDCKPIEKNLKNYARQVDTLILWLDCDREGENIAYEVVDIVRSANPRVNILRAHFSALTERDIVKAVNTLQYPNKNLSDAVDIRQQIDLIIGASFTRLQTLTFRNIFYANRNNNNNDQKQVISYGPCQFPTLNFIVERTEKIRNFKPEEFYYIELKVKKYADSKDIEVEFSWKRNRLFDKLVCLTLYEKVMDSQGGKITNVRSNPKTRLRPLPLNTVEMQKLISKKLRINSHETMEIAEKLYQKGYISYPRTETQKFGKNEIKLLKKIVEEQVNSNEWGNYAQKLLEDERKYTLPRMGRLDDQAHPPIHPVKYADPSVLNEKEKKIYELLVRHFLACVSPDATGKETIIELEMGAEFFTAKGLIIEDPGYLDIYPYDKWYDTYLPVFLPGEVITPSRLFFQTGKTTPPSFLTEAELIGLMDKQGIGTDATIHEHIKHIQERGYAIQQGSIFKPTLIGTALIKSYESLGIELYKPYLRAAMERDMKEVCEGKKQRNSVFNEMKREMRKLFDRVNDSISRMKQFLEKFLEDNKDYEQQIHVSLNISFNNNRNRYRDNLNNNEDNNNNDHSNNNPDDHDHFDGGPRGGRGGRGGKRGGRGGKKGGGVEATNSNIRQRDNNRNNHYSDYDALDSDNEKYKSKKKNIFKSTNINQSENFLNDDFKSAGVFSDTELIHNQINKNNFPQKSMQNNNFKNFENKNFTNSNISNNNRAKFGNFNNNNVNNNLQSNSIYNSNNNPFNQNPYNKNSNNFNSNQSFNNINNSLAKCSKCSQSMRLILNKGNQTYFMGCSGYPNCKFTHNINNPINCVLSNNKCNKCLNKNLTNFMYELTYSEGNKEFTCLGGCLQFNKENNNNFKKQNKRNDFEKYDDGLDDELPHFNKQKKNSNNIFRNNAFKIINNNNNNKKNHKRDINSEEDDYDNVIDNIDYGDFML